MSGTLTIRNGSNRTVKVISKGDNSEEIFVIPNNNDYKLILNEDCKIHITNNVVNTTSCRLASDNNSKINMKVLKMSSNETDVSSMFGNNRWLKEFNHNVRDNWNNVTNMRNMFYSCTSLTSVTLPNELPSVTDIGQMFYSCTSLTSVTLPNELPNVTFMSHMFGSCTSLTSVTLPNELPSVTDMSYMFGSCTSLTSVTLPNELPNVTFMSYMFHTCTNLTSVTLPNELPSVTDMSYMFGSCTSFNGNLSNTKFKRYVDRGSGSSAYDYDTPLWKAVNKPQFTL